MTAYEGPWDRAIIEQIASDRWKVGSGMELSWPCGRLESGRTVHWIIVHTIRRQANAIEEDGRYPPGIRQSRRRGRLFAVEGEPSEQV
jgi:hypothetical protein